MFVKCSEHRKSTQLNGGLKITSSFHSKLGMIYLLLISWPTYSIQLSTEKLQDHKFSSLHRAGRYHKNVKETIAPFIFVSCVSRPPLTNPYVCILKYVGIFSAKKHFLQGQEGKYGSAQDSRAAHRCWGTQSGTANLPTNIEAFPTSICQLNISPGSLPFFLNMQVSWPILCFPTFDRDMSRKKSHLLVSPCPSKTGALIQLQPNVLCQLKLPIIQEKLDMQHFCIESLLSAH